MNKQIILFTLLLASLLNAQEITEGTVTNRDILDALSVKAWSWEVFDTEGFKGVMVDVEVYERDKNNEWERIDTKGHGFSSTDSRTSDRVVIMLRDQRFFLKVGETYSDLDIKLTKSRLRDSVYHNVNNIGQPIEDGFIIMSEYIDRHRATTPIDDRNFYVLVKIKTTS